MSHRLGIVATIFNPLGWQRIADNYRRFADDVLARSGRDVVVAEVLYPGQSPSIEGALHLYKPQTSPMFDKEAALNVAAAALPARCTAVAWIDADITFGNGAWIDDAERVLQTFAVSQLFRWSHWTDRTGNIVHSIEGWAAKAPHYGHPGFAWAARRELFPLDDRHIVGNGDIFNAAGWSGRFDQPQAMRYPQAARRAWLQTAWQQYQQAGGRIGVVEGSVVHRWHGERKHRQYVERLEILNRHDFDPATDLRRLDNGLLDWVPGRKPALEAEIARYLQDRRDDG